LGNFLIFYSYEKINNYPFFLNSVCATYSQQSPKREIRGTWIHTVGNREYPKMNTQEMQQYYHDVLDTFADAGINAVIYQARPTADAFFVSEYEPWSLYLTGVQGKAPDPLWDPLAFMIEECHNRGMELHAWFNPYRITFNDTEELNPNHLFFKKPYPFLRRPLKFCQEKIRQPENN